MKEKEKEKKWCCVCVTIIRIISLKRSFFKRRSRKKKDYLRMRINRLAAVILNHRKQIFSFIFNFVLPFFCASSRIRIDFCGLRAQESYFSVKKKEIR